MPPPRPVKRGFIEKLIENLGRLRPEDVRTHVLRIVREKGFLETIFNAIQEGVIVADPVGRIVYLNEAASRFFGLDRDGSLGKPLAERIRGLDWSALISAEKVVSRDMEVFYPANRYLNFYVVPLSLQEAGDRDHDRGRDRDEAEQVGYAMIVRDITETRRHVEKTLESERLSAVTLLAANVAHEVGNPLNSLNIHLQLLERKLRKLPADQRAELDQLVGVAKDEIRRLDFIVTQFLRAIRPAPVRTEPASLNDLLRESVSFLRPEITDRDILVELELAADLPRLELDRDQMKQAFYNVIRNSFQAMKSGGILRVRSRLEPMHVAVVFTDTGGGISPENLGKVFDPYFTTKTGGSGLGLLIVRRIVRDHGGEIELQSQEGRGLVFTIRLPRPDRQARLLELRGPGEES